MPAVFLPGGSTLLRVHRAGQGAIWYGNKDANWRFDAPDGSYGCLYVGTTLTGPFVETILRAPAEDDRDVLWSDIEKRASAQIALAEGLNLAALHGAGLAWHGVQAADIVADDYTRTQNISARVFKQTTLDGIQYRSRFDNDELCIAIFDRAAHKLALVQENIPIDRIWAYDTLKARGYALIDA